MALIDNLVAYWTMDEAASSTRLDSIGSNDLTDVSDVGARSGIINNGGDYDSSSYLWAADADDLSPANRDWSMYAWFIYDAFGTDRRIAQKGGAGTFEYDWQTNTSGSHRVFLSASGSSRTDWSVTWGSTISTGTTYFGAWGHDAAADDAWISINAGTPVTANVGSGGIHADAAVLNVGQGAFDGMIDEMAIFTRDIRSDLSEFYNSGAGLPFPFRGGSQAIIIASKIHDFLGELKAGLLPPDELRARYGELMTI